MGKEGEWRRDREEGEREGRKGGREIGKEGEWRRDREGERGRKEDVNEWGREESEERGREEGGKDGIYVFGANWCPFTCHLWRNVTLR